MAKTAPTLCARAIRTTNQKDAAVRQLAKILVTEHRPFEAVIGDTTWYRVDLPASVYVNVAIRALDDFTIYYYHSRMDRDLDTPQA